MIAKTENEISNIRTAGRYLAEVLDELQKMVKPGASTAAFDIAAENAIRARGCSPAFLGYKPEGAEYPFPAVLCISLNEEIVHGIPREDRLLEEGDLVTLDLGLSYDGYFVDSAVTVPVGECSGEDMLLLSATREAMNEAIAAAKAGGHIGDIGAAVERVAKQTPFSIVEDLGGHAVGKTVHEKPFIPNFGRAGKGEKIVEGMVLAIEPMLSVGSPRIVLDEDDQWTYRTSDGSRTAHFEHTVLITKDGPEIVTKL
jgi:methionyl aminopeptidase